MGIGTPVFPKPTDQERIVMRFCDVYWAARPYSPIARRCEEAAAQALAEIEAEQAKKGTHHELVTEET